MQAWRLRIEGPLMSARHRGRKRRTASESLCPQDQTGSLYPTTSHRLDDILPHERKSRQLCEQVAESLSLAFATCDDPELLDCHVLEVEPWPGPGRLRVTVALDREVDPESLLAALSRAASCVIMQRSRPRADHLRWRTRANEGARRRRCERE